MKFGIVISISLFFTLASFSTSSTPEATPTADYGCSDLETYFLTLAELTSQNGGYLAVTSNPTGAFGLPSDETTTNSNSLSLLIDQLSAIIPPAAAELYHQAFIDQIAWYRDLVTAVDFASYQRIVNRDKQLVPAMSRAIFAGHGMCGSEFWIDAYNNAFGDEK